MTPPLAVCGIAGFSTFLSTLRVIKNNSIFFSSHYIVLFLHHVLCSDFHSLHDYNNPVNSVDPPHCVLNLQMLDDLHSLGLPIIMLLCGNSSQILSLALTLPLNSGLVHLTAYITVSLLKCFPFRELFHHNLFKWSHSDSFYPFASLFFSIALITQHFTLYLFMICMSPHM